MAGERVVRITILGDSRNAEQAMGNLAKSGDQLEAKVTGLGGKFSQFGSVAAGVLTGGALLGIGRQLGDMAKGAADDSASMGRLQQAIERANGSFGPYAKQVDDAIKRGQQLAFSDDQTREALTLLTAETGDSNEALRRLSAAQDLARGTGMDLGAAAKLLGRVTDETTGVLGRYGIQVEKGANAQDVLNKVDAAFGGQAGKFASSDAAKWARLTDQLSEAGESIGGILLPAFAGLAAGAEVAFTAVQPLINFVGDHIQPIIAAMAGLAVTITAAVIPAFVAWAAAAIPAAATTALALAPVVLAAGAVGAAAVLLYEAWTHNWLGIRDITAAVWAALQPVFAAIQARIDQFVDQILPELLATWQTISAGIQAVMQVLSAVTTTIFSAIASFIQQHADTITTILTSAWTIIQTTIGAALTIIQNLIELALNVIQGDWSGAWENIKTILSTAWEAIQTIVSAGVDLLKATLSLGWDVIKIGAFNAWEAIKGTLSAAWDAMVQIVTDAIPRMVSAFASMGRDAGAALVDAALDSLSSQWHKLTDWLGDHVLHIGGVLGIGGGGSVGSSFGQSSSGMIKPIAGTFTQGFYGAYSHGSESAIDWMAPRGTPVYAPASGVVAVVGNNLDGRSGPGLDIYHDNGLETVYGHMSGVVVSPGQRVTQGQLIGYSGDPAIDGGYGSGAHLHMAIKRNGGYVSGDASQYVPLAEGGFFPAGRPMLGLIGEGRHDEVASPVPVMADTVRRVVRDELAALQMRITQPINVYLGEELIYSRYDRYRYQRGQRMLIMGEG